MRRTVQVTPFPIHKYLRCFCEEERIFFLVPTVGRTDYTTARVSLDIMKNFLTIKRAEQVSYCRCRENEAAL